MKYKVPLPAELIPAAAALEDFANGGAQATIALKDGRTFNEVLISNGSAVVAIRGHKDPPFASSEIAAVSQSEEDKKPRQTGGWEYWDKWQ